MIKGEFNNIKIPYNLDDFIDESIDKAAKEKKKVLINKYKKSFAITAAGIIIALTVGMINNPTAATKIPLIGSVFENIQDRLQISGDYSNYADEVNESVYDNGVRIKLSEVYCDGESLYISYLIESDVPFKYREYPFASDADCDITEDAGSIEVNQLLYEGEGKVDFIDGFLDNSGVAGLEGRYIDDYTFVGVEKYNLREMVERSGRTLNIPDSFKFSISITNIRCNSFDTVEKDQIIKGEWNFNIDVFVDKSSTEKIQVNSLNGEGIGVKEVLVTPFEVKVITEHPQESKNFEYSTCIIDENGNDIAMNCGSWNEITCTTTFPRDIIKGEKIKISLYKNINKEQCRHMADEAFYETEVNLK